MFQIRFLSRMIIDFRTSLISNMDIKDKVYFLTASLFILKECLVNNFKTIMFSQIYNSLRATRIKDCLTKWITKLIITSPILIIFSKVLRISWTSISRSPINLTITYHLILTNSLTTSNHLITSHLINLSSTSHQINHSTISNLRINFLTKTCLIQDSIIILINLTNRDIPSSNRDFPTNSKVSLINKDTLTTIQNLIKYKPYLSILYH